MHDAQLKSRTKPGNFSANLCLKHPRVSATPALWRKTNNHSAPALYLTARVGGKRCRVSFRAKALFRQDSAHHRRCRQDKHAHAVKNTVQKKCSSLVSSRSPVKVFRLPVSRTFQEPAPLAAVWTECFVRLQSSSREWNLEARVFSGV